MNNYSSHTNLMRFEGRGVIAPLDAPACWAKATGESPRRIGPLNAPGALLVKVMKERGSIAKIVSTLTAY